MATAVKMGPNAGPNYSIEVPQGSMVFAVLNGGSLIDPQDLGYEVSKIYIITPFTFEATVQIRGVIVPYSCMIIPTINAGTEMNKHPNTLNPDLRDHVTKEFQGRVIELLMSHASESFLTMFVEHKQRRYTCRFDLRLSNS